MMGILQALHLKPREIKAARSPLVTALMVYSGQEVVWMKKDYEAFAKEGYQACQDAYACIEVVAKAIESVPIIAFEGDEDNETELKSGHPLLEILHRPNRRQSGTKLIGSLARFIMIAGNGYTVGLGPTNGPNAGIPKELYTLQPHRTSVLVGNEIDPIKGYRYRTFADKQDYPVEDVMHLALFHPTDDVYGLSPIEVIASNVDVSNLGLKWNAKMLKNDMRPSAAFIFEKLLTPEQRADFKADIKESQQGPAGSGNFLMLENVKEYKQLSINAKEGDWTNLDKLTTRKICRGFGVAPELIGDSENKTYANYKEARLALYIDTAIPLLAWMVDEFNTWLVPKFRRDRRGDGKRIRLAIDLDHIDALQEQREKAWERMGNAWFLKFNEKRQAVGYQPEIGAIGDMYHLPIGLIETSAAGEGSGGGGDDTGKAGRKNRPELGLWGDASKRKHLWLAFEARVKAREKSFDKIAEAYLKRQADEIRRRAQAATTTNGLRPETLLNVAKERDAYLAKFWPWYVDHFIRAGNAGMFASKGDVLDDGEAKMELGPGCQRDKPSSWIFDMTDEEKAELERIVLESGTKVNETTVQTILEMIQAANLQNQTVNELGQAIYDKIGDLTRWKAQLWSRTESAKVDNFGQLEGFKRTEFVDKRAWGCSFVPDSRDAHMRADGQIRKLDEPFTVGSKQMMYPGDPAGGAENSCNCLCFQTPIVGKAASRPREGLQ